jgi:hypothetical protein
MAREFPAWRLALPQAGVSVSEWAVRAWPLGRVSASASAGQGRESRSVRIEALALPSPLASFRRIGAWRLQMTLLTT